MKQLLSMMLTAIVFSMSACNSGTNTTAVATINDAGQKNLLAANSINKAIEMGDMSNLGDYIAPDAIDHSGQHGDVVGLDSIKTGLAPLHKMATNDLKMEVVKELADSEYVFQWVRTTGTAATTDMGVPVGSKFSVVMISVSKFKNGKATEHWEFMQPADMMKMMAPPQKGK
jgi:predicted SnoaL-like aldol condensation-catalyzing enzyme